MGQISVSGSIIGGPASASEGFPSAQFITQLKLRQSPMGFGAATGVLTQRLNSPSGFAELVGPGTVVTRATFLYIRSDTDLLVRLTTDDGAGGDDVVVIPVGGLFLFECSGSKYLKLLEAQGSALIEYLAAGSQ